MNQRPMFTAEQLAQLLSLINSLSDPDLTLVIQFCINMKKERKEKGENDDPPYFGGMFT